MPETVIILSTDFVRGKIVHAVLKRSGYPVRLCTSFLEGRDAVRTLVPRVAIFDVKGYAAGSMETLRSFHQDFAGNSMIVLVDQTLLAPVEALGMDRVVCLVEPLDPEQIVTMVRQYSAAAPRPRPQPTLVAAGFGFEVYKTKELEATVEDLLKLK